MSDSQKATLGIDVIKLVIAFVLTTIVGGLLTYWFQTRQAQVGREAAIVAADRENATRVFEDVSRLLGERMYRLEAAKLLRGFTGEQPQNPFQDAFVAAFDSAWEVNLSRNRALICRYFGPELAVLYARDIHDQFRKVALGAQIADTTEVQRRVILQEQIHRLNDGMIESIRSGRFATTSASKCDSLPNTISIFGGVYPAPRPDRQP